MSRGRDGHAGETLEQTLHARGAGKTERSTVRPCNGGVGPEVRWGLYLLDDTYSILTLILLLKYWFTGVRVKEKLK